MVSPATRWYRAFGDELDSQTFYFSVNCAGNLYHFIHNLLFAVPRILPQRPHPPAHRRDWPMRHRYIRSRGSSPSLPAWFSHHPSHRTDLFCSRCLAQGVTRHSLWLRGQALSLSHRVSAKDRQSPDREFLAFLIWGTQQAQT